MARKNDKEKNKAGVTEIPSLDESVKVNEEEKVKPLKTRKKLSSAKEKRSSIENSDIINAQKKRKKRFVAADLSGAERYFPDKDHGLSAEQVASRNEKGYVNETVKKEGKTYRSIFFSNIFTFFNILTFIVGAALIVVIINEPEEERNLAQLFFLVIILANITIGIVQEIKSKRTVDKLSLITAPTTTVIREGQKTIIPVTDIVLDDVIYTETGKQLCADAVVLSGEVEVNESMLTGESEAIKKHVGDTLYSGSFVSSGSCYARVDKVGASNYIEILASHAKKYRKPKSELQSSIRLIMKIVTCFIVPISIAMLSRDLIGNPITAESLMATIKSSAGAIIGMIPAGMFLLTSVALAVGVVRLGKRHTLVKDLYCIEMLARADVLCLDKTGTITDGSMQVRKVVPLVREDNIEEKISLAIGSMLTATGDNNQTALALAAHFGYNAAYKPDEVLAFSSQRKLSAVTFEEEGTYILGAPEFVLKEIGVRLDRLVAEYASQGYRVMCLAHSDGEIGEFDKLPATRRAIALIIIEDHIREDAVETVKWFKDNGVAVKIISGDNPVTVSEVAKRVGVENADKFISLEGLSSQEVIEAANKYTVFGRVTPEQKCLLVRALKTKGHTVAMTGDGVNDILAMREADCAIAIASGAEAARKVSHLVLLDSNFTSMPDVVMEGRRVVNNITKSSALFLTKTFMSIVLSIIYLFLDDKYPFETNNLLLLELFVIGVPSFCLALQSNKNQIRGGFLANVISRAIPGGSALVINIMALYFYKNILATSWGGAAALSNEMTTSLMVTVLAFTGVVVLCKICEPLNIYRIFVLASSILLIIGAMQLLPTQFGLVSMDIGENVFNFMHFLFATAIVLCSYFIITLVMKLLTALNVMFD